MENKPELASPPCTSYLTENMSRLLKRFLTGLKVELETFFNLSACHLSYASEGDGPPTNIQTDEAADTVAEKVKGKAIAMFVGFI